MKYFAITLLITGVVGFLGYRLLFPVQDLKQETLKPKEPKVSIKQPETAVSVTPKTKTEKAEELVPVKNADSKINLTNQIAIVSDKAFPASKGHSIILSKLNDEDKKAFREIDVEGRKIQKVLGLGTMNGEPNTIVGPIRLQTKPNKPIFLRAIDKGVFTNGAPEIFVKADEKGLVQVDFKFGIGLGPYRVLIQTAGCAPQQVTFTCQPKEKQMTEAKEIGEMKIEKIKE